MAERLTVRCASESRARDEPLLGTASRVRRWLVVEQPGPWGREALVESRLEPVVARGLQAMGRRHGVRVLLARLPRRATSGEGTRRAYLAHSGRDASWIEQLDLDDPAALLDLDLSVLASAAPPGIGSTGPAVVHLVCTNGRHDPCCADLGRPVVRALEGAGVPEVWESSHVGGDRFAANVVCLPHGTYFGRVDPDGAADLLRAFAAGVLDLDRYRGRSCLPPLAQAAEVFARRRLEEPGVDALRLVASEAAGDELRVRFEHGDDDVHVQVARERAEVAPLTCHGAPGSPWRYALRSLEVRPRSGSHAPEPGA